MKSGNDKKELDTQNDPRSRSAKNVLVPRDTAVANFNVVTCFFPNSYLDIMFKNVT